MKANNVCRPVQLEAIAEILAFHCHFPDEECPEFMADIICPFDGKECRLVTKELWLQAIKLGMPKDAQA